ncbi:MAG: hypothetical protein ACOX5W_11315 [Bacillota bacterium]
MKNKKILTGLIALTLLSGLLFILYHQVFQRDYLEAPSQVVKPADVQTIENTLGITMTGEGDSWRYSLQKEEVLNSPWQSYLEIYQSDGVVKLMLNYPYNSPGLKEVAVELNPMNKILNSYFPEDAELTASIMDSIQQSIAKMQESNGFDKPESTHFTANSKGIVVQTLKDYPNLVTLVIYEREEGVEWVDALNQRELS